MAVQHPDPDIERLLVELRSDDPNRRQAAAEEIATRKLRNDEIIKELRANAFSDTNEYARQAAEHALLSLGVNVSPAPASAPKVGSPAKAVEPLSRRSKIVQFTIGFVGWYLINFSIYAVTSSGGQGIGSVYIVFPANVIVLIVLAFKRRWVALGMLSAIALNLVVALIMGIQVAGFCFIPFFTPGLR